MDAPATCVGAARQPKPAHLSRASTRRSRLSRVAGLGFALAGLLSSAELTASRSVEPAGRGAYDPLLSDTGNVCTPAVAGRPPLLQQLVLAQAETKPFRPQPMQAAGGEVPLYNNLGTLSFKVGTRDAKAQAYLGF